jgi:hypothetical protein
MRRTTFASVLASISLIILLTGCTDPTQAPILVQLLPNPVAPQSTPQNLDFFGSNLDTDVYFILDTGTQEILLDPQNAPGHWTFRCVFGFHFIYTFDSLEDFILSIGSPSSLTVRAFNPGTNLVPEPGGGDDLSSQGVTWQILD